MAEAGAGEGAGACVTVPAFSTMSGIGISRGIDIWRAVDGNAGPAKAGQVFRVKPFSGNAFDQLPDHVNVADQNQSDAHATHHQVEVNDSHAGRSMLMRVPSKKLAVTAGSRKGLAVLQLVTASSSCVESDRSPGASGIRVDHGRTHFAKV